MMLNRAGCLVLLLVAAACSPKRMAMNSMASALADATAVYDNDNDTEFVRLAAPSTLKTLEMLLVEVAEAPDAVADGVQRVHPGTRTGSSMSRRRSGPATRRRPGS